MKGLLFAFLLIAAVPLKAQKVIWEKIYNKNRGTVYSVTETNDGCFVIGGEINYQDGHGRDVYLAKVDKNGKKLWEKRFGGDYDDRCYALSKTKDGGFILAGTKTSYTMEAYTGSVPSEPDVYLIRTDENGNKIWEKTFGGEEKDKANAIIQTKDSNFIIAGVTKSFGAGEEDIYLIKINRNGKKIWSKTFGGKKEDKANAILETEDGGLIIAGLTRTFSKGEGDVFLIKTDKNGKKIWQKTFGGEDGDEAYSIIETEDGFITAGYTYSYGNNGDFYLIKVDKKGNKVWEKTIGTRNYEIAYSISRCSDNGLIVAGLTNIVTGFNVPYVARIKDELGKK
jgi:regulation of enolase protein 1 (concanavalin A-like superfamily)